jgi:ABC-type glutathione transport system ATPase component
VVDQSLLEIQGLCLASIDADGVDQVIVDQLDLQLDRGQSLGLLGQSGSGKSMTALAILGLLPSAIERTAGRICFAGTNLCDLSEAQLRQYRGGRMAMVFQDPASALNPVLRVGFQVEEVLRLHRPLDAAGRRLELLRLFEEVQLPDPIDLLRRYPHELSGGQRQRVMLAMALAGEPELLIADEPTTALDVTVQAQILDLVEGIRRQRGLAMLWISHDLGVVASCCDQVAVMFQGQLVEQGEVASVFADPQHSHTQKLLASIPGRNGLKSPAAVVAAEEVAPSTRLGPDELLRIQGLKVRYLADTDWLGRPRAWKTAVDDVDLVIHPGETVALVGESGSGKTSLGRALLRLTPAAAGNAWFRPPGLDAVDLLALSPRQLRPIRRHLSLVFQDPYTSLNPRLPVWRSVAEPLEIHRVVARTQLRARVDSLFRQVQLDPQLGQRLPGQLSGGQRQRVAIARALALEPALVICDEAVSALDLAVQASVLELLKELQLRHAMAYLFITHDLAVVREIADRVAVMKDGQIVESGSVHEIFQAPQQIYTRTLLSAAPELPS